ncbi:hypothetical protein H0H92_010299 [Tricholoma furcatifolium]|nr:hypothetical protein H0H92_010299 [Tricholoma furcatifolium]
MSDIHIVHNDFDPQNTGINVITNEEAWYLPGLRNSEQVRYAIYDFGYSEIYPVDESLFSGEMRILGSILQFYARHLESTIPALGPFFDDLTCDSEKVLTARQALERFHDIKNSLTPGQLASPVHGREWHPDRTKSKEQEPMDLPANFVPWNAE